MDPKCWFDAALRHWEEKLPNKYARLRRSGMLVQEVSTSVERMAAAMTASFYDGDSWDAAWEIHSSILFPSDVDDDLPASEGYLAMRELNQSLGSLKMPGEREE